MVSTTKFTRADYMALPEGYPSEELGRSRPHRPIDTDILQPQVKHRDPFLFGDEQPPWICSIFSGVSESRPKAE